MVAKSEGQSYLIRKLYSYERAPLVSKSYESVQPQPKRLLQSDPHNTSSSSSSSSKLASPPRCTLVPSASGAPIVVSLTVLPGV